MRSVVGAVLVGVIFGAACGGSTDNKGKSNDGGSGGSAAGASGSDATGGTAAAGKPQGGTPNVAGTSPINGAGVGNVGQGGVPDDGGGSIGGWPGAEAGAGGEISTNAGASGSAGEAGATGQGGEGGGDSGPVIDCACDAGEACLKVLVTRDASTVNQPWILWPTQADGTGTLTVSAVSTTYMIQDKVTLPASSFVAADAAYGAALCVPPGQSNVRAFLDDNDDEHPNAVTSSDYLDSCATGDGTCARCYGVTTTAGAEIEVPIALKHSCD